MIFRTEVKYVPTNATFIEEMSSDTLEQLEAYYQLYNKEIIQIFSVRAEIPTDLTGEVQKILMSCGIDI